MAAGRCIKISTVQKGFALICSNLGYLGQLQDFVKKNGASLWRILSCLAWPNLAARRSLQDAPSHQPPCIGVAGTQYGGWQNFVEFVGVVGDGIRPPWPAITHKLACQLLLCTVHLGATSLVFGGAPGSP